MSSLTQLLRAVKERLERATPGPWCVQDDSLPVEVWTHPQDTRVAVLDQSLDFAPGKTKCYYNAELIAHAPTYLAKLARICEVQAEALGMVDHVGMPAPYASHVRAAIEQADAIAAEGGEG